MKSHTVPRFLLDQFAYDDPMTGSRSLWEYRKGRRPYGSVSPTVATRINHHFADPADAEREKRLETRLNDEFEYPVHKFLSQFRYRTFVLSPIHIRQLTRYTTLLFNRSKNRRGGTKQQVEIAIKSTRSFIADTEKLAKVAARWTFEMIRQGYELDRAVDANDVRRAGERMIAEMQTAEHQQTTYCDSMERAMAFLDEPLANGQWNIMHTTEDFPFVIGNAPVISWHRLENGVIIHGQGFATPNVEVVLPVGKTVCLHILPVVPRNLIVRQPTVREVNEAQAAFATSCYAHKNDPALDQILQPRFGERQIGINAYSAWHRNYDDTMFELFMSGGRKFIAPRR